MQRAPPEEEEEGEMYDDVRAIKTAPAAADDDNEILYEAEPMYHVCFFMLISLSLFVGCFIHYVSVCEIAC